MPAASAGIIGAAISGASALGSSFLTSGANRAASDKANLTAMWLAQHAHQTEVADLRAAGLNPILSAWGKGSPQPSMQVPVQSFDLGGGAAVQGYESAMRARKTGQEINIERPKEMAANLLTSAAKPLADSISEVIPSVAGAVGEAVTSALKDTGAIVGTKLEDWTTGAKQSLTRIPEAYQTIVTDAGEYIGSHLRNAGRALTGGPTKFVGTRESVMRDIAAIPDKAKRDEVYRAWKDQDFKVYPPSGKIRR